MCDRASSLPAIILKHTVWVACLAAMPWGCSLPTAGQSSGATTLGAVSVADASAVDVASLTLPLELPGEPSSEGGLIAFDVDGDQQFEIVVTRPGYIAVYSLTEGKQWQAEADIWLTQKSETEGLPGLHAPGIQAGDIDQDGAIELLYVTSNNQLAVLAGASGEMKYQVDLPVVASLHDRWEHAIIADFTGQGDRELLLQASRATNREAYVRDSVQAAFSLRDLLTQGADAQPLWLTDSFISLSHGAPKVLDINDDGRDEVVGGTILSAAGQVLHDVGIENRNFPHIDSVAIGDIVPDRPGLEGVLPEEAGEQRVFLYDDRGTIWQSHHRDRSFDRDGDKVAIGEFDPDRPGLEMWFRGNESDHFTVLDAESEVIASYRTDQRKPDSWTDKGFDVIHRIRWTGDTQDHIVAKERHEAGDVGVFDAITGEIVAQFPGATVRLYVADVMGDWREEIITLEAEALRVYQNTAPNPNPDRPSLWEQQAYRRQKMTWNYYSP